MGGGRVGDSITVDIGIVGGGEMGVRWGVEEVRGDVVGVGEEMRLSWREKGEAV